MTYSVPADYDAVTMTVAPVDLITAGQQITAAVTEIVDCLNAIDNTLDGLQLGWAGSTAAEAKDFGDQWSAAMIQMFGTKAAPGEGVMNVVIFALMSAGNNYDAAEDAICQMFNGFGTKLSPAAGAARRATAPA